MIKTLIVDDSAIVREILKDILEDDNRFEIVGFAENGKKAVEMYEELQSDLIIMDINMPVMNGIEASKEILSKHDTAIIVFSTIEDSQTAYQCLSYGVLEFINKPDFSVMTKEFFYRFTEQIYQIAENHKNKSKHNIGKGIKSKIASLINGTTEKNNCYELLVIGASTGGPQAILSVLKGLGKNFPLPIVVTQHIDKVFDIQMTKWLNENAPMKAQLAEDYQILEKGKVYIAPADSHLTLKKQKEGGFNYVSVLDNSSPVHFLRPAVDKMFTSASQVSKDKTLAVILTGMGTDGTQGACCIKKAGGFVIAEAEEDCIVFGMPKAAIDAKCVDAVLPLSEIGSFINKKIGNQQEN